MFELWIQEELQRLETERRDVRRRIDAVPDWQGLRTLAFIEEKKLLLRRALEVYGAEASYQWELTAEGHEALSEHATRR